jgi:hypothetical protein
VRCLWGSIARDQDLAEKGDCMNSRDAKIRYGISLSDADGVERWRERAQADEQERARAQRELRREQQTDSLTQLRADMGAEFESVRAEMTARQECLSEAVGQVLEENAEAAVDCIERAVKKVHNELFSLIERRFGELTGRVDALMGSSGKARSEKFRSKESPVDLPNPLPRGRGLN